MPESFSHPGVYVEEIPGVHAIAGVPTSIAAFIGWAARGPTSRTSLVQSWAEFEAGFGGFNANDGVYLGYAVNQFFANGGQEAYIIRLGWDGTLTAAPGTTPAPCATARAIGIGGGLTLFAASPGLWGNAIAVAIATAPSPGRFGLQVSFGGIVVESFADLAIAAADARYAVRVIESQSSFISFIDPATKAIVVPTTEPGATAAPAPLAGGADGAVLVPASDGNFEAVLASDAGVKLLDQIDIFNLLCAPGETDAATIRALQDYCARRRAFYIVDAPQTASFASLKASGPVGTAPGGGTPASIVSAPNAANSAYYFPWVLAPDPPSGGAAKLWPPCGFVAGVYAATDSARGVWKAPAGVAATLTGAAGLQYALTDIENGELNAQGVNCLRHFAAYGDVIWGARTLLGADQAGSEWKYAPVRRLALFLESSLYAGLKWVVFEPNGEALWSEIRASVGAFMHQLFTAGAFQGVTPMEAYFVRCDATNNPPSEVGVVNVTIGFAPLLPAEFELIQIQQILGSN